MFFKFLFDFMLLLSVLVSRILLFFSSLLYSIFLPTYVCFNHYYFIFSHLFLIPILMSYNIFLQLFSKEVSMNYWNQFQIFPQYSNTNGSYPNYFPASFVHQWQTLPFTIYQSDGPNFVISPTTQPNCDMKGLREGQNEEDVDKTIKKSKNEEKNQTVSGKKASTQTRNIKANIFRDFIRSIKKDASQLLFAKQILHSNYSIKKFTEQLTSSLPNQDKYIRMKLVADVCRNHEDKQFAYLLRVMLRNFLKGEYRNFIVLKRKNKLQYLRGCRQIMLKLEEQL